MDYEEDLGRWVNQLSHQIKRRMDAQLSSMGITGVQSRTLHFIISRTKERPVFQRDVEDAFHLRRSTATGILQLLEKGDLIWRESVSYDARLKRLVPTEKAVAIHAQMRACIRETEGLLVQNIDPEQLQIFRRVLLQMSDNLGS